jgi:hypothetical protein
MSMNTAQMHRLASSMFVIMITMMLSSLALGQSITDDFASYPSGSDASPAWSPAGGFWYVADGSVCEDSGAYDSGLFATTYQGATYEASVRFRVDDGHMGAGFLFNSASASSNAYAHMVRLADDRIIYGYLQEGAYNPVGDVATPAHVSRGQWHTFELRVDPTAGTYSFGIDGTMLRRDLPLRYQTGYVAIENSGGRACFDDFRLRPTSDATPRSVAWPEAVSARSDGSVWVGSAAAGTVRLLSSQGDVLVDLNASASRPFIRPTAVQAISDGGVIVLDAGAGRIHHYDATGAWVATGGGTLDEPFDVAVVADGTIAVSDPGNERILFFDRSLKAHGTLEWTDQYEPGPIAAYGSKLAFVDRDAGAVHLLERSGDEWTRRQTFYTPPGAVRGIALGPDAVFVAVDTVVRKFDLTGREIASLDLGMLNRLLPQRLSVVGDQLYIADFVGDRIIEADTELTSPTLQHEFANDRLDLSWTSAFRTPGRVEVRIDEQLWETQEGPAGNDHQFSFAGVEPSTLYRVRYTPGVSTIPQTNGLSREMVFMSPPPTGQTHFREIKGAVLLFTDVIDTSRVTDAWPEQPPLEQAEVQRILAQVEDGRRFFWMNSGMRLHLDLDYYIVNDAKERAELFGSSSYYPPNTEVTEQVLRDHGVDISDYESIFYLVVVRDYDPETGEWDVRGPGGAFTQGLGWNGNYGRSWWEVTREDHASGNNWLVVHEFHHQLDELFQISGYPEYWFNHFSPHIGTSGRFGEHFDGNAHILREWPADQYFALKHGALAFASDADGDGIPDDAPHLPMDEKRLGSNANAIDSSGDGVSDRDALSYSNWVVEGVGESYAQPALFPDLTAFDTNGNGIPDAQDPHPHFRFPTALAKGEFVVIGLTDEPRAPHRVEASWSRDSLFVRFEPPAGRHIKVLVDANADGWFAGRDNIQFKLDTSTMEEQVDVFHAGRSDSWPQMNAELSQTVAQSWRLVDGAYQLAIPRNPRLGLNFDEGEMIGLVYGVSIPEYHPRLRNRFMTVHEPNRFVYFTLVGDDASARAIDSSE